MDNRTNEGAGARRTVARTISARGGAIALGFTLAFGAALLATPLHALAQAAATPVGLWKSIDDETKKPKSLIRITDSGGVLSGKVEKILTDKTDAKCDKCTDDRKDKPVQGMTILTGMKKDGEGWGGGEILDPNNGKTYRSQMTLIEGGKKLEVRGFVGIALFGRTQTWIREE